MAGGHRAPGQEKIQWKRQKSLAGISQERTGLGSEALCMAPSSLMYRRLACSGNRAANKWERQLSKVLLKS
ncbi:hypothetical protein AV530_006309 [Patagioenas fasciata monilis]|uniref:Uncharacterized protein n=1 Tax=Patagioenas fasciata monilis TaxID=372326 RepID=A0A1V4KG96_PATFA|nr:hypothetical protein AV530_006309 [Patagioenas fasciata monilis]